MKKLILKCLFYVAWAFCAVSCSTVHKNISSIKKTEDSTAVVLKDTSSISTQVKTNDNFTAKGVDITINFKDSSSVKNPASDTVKWTPTYVPKDQVSPTDNDYVDNLIRDAITSLPTTGQIPSSINIHIDSLTNHDSTSVIKDSTSSSQKSTINVKTNTDTKDKIISKTGLGAGVYIVGGIIVLILIVIGVLKLGLKLW